MAGVGEAMADCCCRCLLLGVSPPPAARVISSNLAVIRGEAGALKSFKSLLSVQVIILPLQFLQLFLEQPVAGQLLLGLGQ